MINLLKSFAVTALLVSASSVTAFAQDDIDWTSYYVDGYEAPMANVAEDGSLIRSGFTYRNSATQAMQLDDFENPGMWRADEGAAAWDMAEGSAGKSCADCHGAAEESMKGVGAVYPKVDAASGELLALEDRINKCREEQMGAEPYKWESDGMLNMTVFVRMQSRGMPVNVAVDGAAAPFFEKGEELYYTRVGQLDMSCAHCHEYNSGGIIRAETLSEGQSNGFPTYRQKWNDIGSIHRRIRGCMDNIRGGKYAYGSDENTNLELYLAWRGRGLPVETPSVRN